MKPIHHVRVLGAGLAAALIAGAAIAQTPPPPQPAPAARAPMDPAQREARRAEHQQRFAQRLRDALQLTPAQEPALQRFLADMKPPPGAREGWRQHRREMKNATTPERLDQRQAMMAQRQQMQQRRIDATKRFYAALTPAQQKAFDAMPKPGREHGRGRHGGDHRRGGPGMPPPPANG